MPDKKMTNQELENLLDDFKSDRQKDKYVKVMEKLERAGASDLYIPGAASAGKEKPGRADASFFQLCCNAYERIAEA